jgi:glycosyltransferase involved in cell wall biosynthesis
MGCGRTSAVEKQIERRLRMKIYAICLVKNEDDVISQTLAYATRYCDKIFVIDNGSTDKTWETVRSLTDEYPQIVPFAQKFEPYDEGLRWFAYDAHHQELTDEDWWLILDGDEFLGEDPRPIIFQAAKEGADIVKAWQIQFYYTETDYEAWLAGCDSRDQQIFARRRFYRIDWQEPRLFRNKLKRNFIFRQSKLLTESSAWGVSVERGKGKVCRRRIFNRHFQYRDPEQITKRLELRYGRPEFAAQVKSLDWRSVMRSSKHLQFYRNGEAWRFSFSGLAHHYSGWVRYILVSRFGRYGRWMANRVGL